VEGDINTIPLLDAFLTLSLSFSYVSLSPILLISLSDSKQLEFKLKGIVFGGGIQIHAQFVLISPRSESNLSLKLNVLFTKKDNNKKI